MPWKPASSYSESRNGVMLSLDKDIQSLMIVIGSIQFLIFIIRSMLFGPIQNTSLCPNVFLPYFVPWRDSNLFGMTLDFQVSLLVGSVIPRTATGMGHVKNEQASICWQPVLVILALISMPFFTWTAVRMGILIRFDSFILLHPPVPRTAEAVEPGSCVEFHGQPTAWAKFDFDNRLHSESG
jgi:hypothetical protein